MLVKDGLGIQHISLSKRTHISYLDISGIIKIPSLGGDQIMQHVWSFFFGFPRKIVHEVWVGNIMTPVSVYMQLFNFSLWAPARRIDCHC